MKISERAPLNVKTVLISVRIFVIIIIIIFISLIYTIQKNLYTAFTARRRGDLGSHRAYVGAASRTLINEINEVKKKCCECAARPIQPLFK